MPPLPVNPVAPPHPAPADHPATADAQGEQAVRTFRAGDHIHHAPTGEDWLLAADEHDGRVICCAWPEALGNASDCALVRAVSDEDHVKVLRAVAEHDGLRGVWARRDLAAIEARKGEV